MNKLEELIRRITSERKVIFLTKYGSNLFGTNTPESDLDLKGVFLPTKNEILLGKIPETISFDSKTSEKGNKNTKDDIDCQLYSWSYFMRLAGSGQTVALEMLSANIHHPIDDPVLLESWEWTELANNRKKFVTKEMKAFVGFARSQAIKYSVKGDKLNTCNDFIAFLKKYSRLISPIKDVWDLMIEDFRMDPNVDWLPETDTLSGVRIVKVCGRGLQETFSAKYCIGILDKVVAKYGVRAHLAATDGADFKAISHAIRVSVQLFELYEYGQINFPLGSAAWLKKIKNGEFSYDHCMDVLNDNISKLEIESEQYCEYPEKVDRDWINGMIIKMHGRIVRT